MKSHARKIIPLFLFLSTLMAQPSEQFPKLAGNYLGQTPPGISPEIFAAGILSTGFNERDITISPDGKEIYYGLLTGKHITIMVTKLVDGKWTEPEVASFAADDNYFHLEPCLSFNGDKIFFLSTRPPKGKEPKPRWTYQNIWVSNRNADGSWGEPYLDTIINNRNAQFYPSLTKDGTIYFSANDLQTKKPVIFRARVKGGSYLLPEKLPSIINGEGISVYNASVSQDEDFLITCIDGIENDINPGCANYYIFFRDKYDNWSNPISFGPEINMKGSNAMSASVSPDGKYLFFAAQKVSSRNKELLKNKTMSSLTQVANSPQNGNNDIYWVDASVVNELKTKAVWQVENKTPE